MKRSLIMKLQLFGVGKFSRPFLDADDGAGNGGEGNQPANQDDPKGEEGNSAEEEPKTFDDILKDNNYKSEFEKRISEAIKVERRKWDATSQTKIDEARTEAEKVAKMTAEQKAKYEEEKRVADIERREKELNTKELKIQADTILAEKNLPKSLSEIVIYENADTCIKSIEVIETAFNEAVESAVNERLRGGTQYKSRQISKIDYNNMSDAEYYAATYKNKK